LSIYENITSDFYWVPSFLNWFGALISDLGPALALFGAIYLYFRKESTERELQRARLETEVYVRFLRLLAEGRDSLAVFDEASRGLDINSALSSTLNELRLVGGVEVYEDAYEIHGQFLRLLNTKSSIGDKEWKLAVSNNLQIRESLKEFFEIENLLAEKMKARIDFRASGKK